jgi:hypothetical protein
MINSIQIGKVIYSKLSENEIIQNVVADRIYPVIAEQTTNYPFIIYYRNSIVNTIFNKDGSVEDDVSFSITVVSTKYNESADLANEIRKIFEKKQIPNNLMRITNSRLIAIDESYEDNAYVQRLTFSCTVNNIN